MKVLERVISTFFFWTAATQYCCCYIVHMEAGQKGISDNSFSGWDISKTTGTTQWNSANTDGRWVNSESQQWKSLGGKSFRGKGSFSGWRSGTQSSNIPKVNEWFVVNSQHGGNTNPFRNNGVSQGLIRTSSLGETEVKSSWNQDWNNNKYQGGTHRGSDETNLFRHQNGWKTNRTPVNENNKGSRENNDKNAGGFAGINTSGLVDYNNANAGWYTGNENPQRPWKNAEKLRGSEMYATGGQQYSNDKTGWYTNTEEVASGYNDSNSFGWVNAAGITPNSGSTYSGRNSW